MSADAAIAPRPRELQMRLLSAAALIPFALWVIWVGGPLCAAACALFASLMAYEWVRMTHSPDMKLMTSMAAIPCVMAYFTDITAAILALLVCMVIAGLSHPLRGERFKAAFGQVYAAGMPLALYLLRADEMWDGRTAALLLMAIVWASDSGAYFTGRALGGPLLSSISPTKTWSGAVGALFWSALVGLAIAFLFDKGAAAWVMATLAISVIAQAGDLFESVLKRAFGVKHASALVPGHGGIMDRVDGLGAAAVCSLIALLVWPGLTQSLDLVR